MLGTIINAVAIILGTIFGCFLKGSFPDRIKTTIMQGISATVIVIGLSMAIKTQNMLVVTLSMVVGGIIGELLNIEKRLNDLGEGIKRHFSQDDDNFTRAFVSASLIYCVGAMAIMGSIQSGLTGDHSTLLVKSVLDGISSIVFSSSMGIGVAFSSLPVLVYQGSITLAASYVKEFATEAIITEMSAVGGVLIFCIGINMLDIKANIRVGNLLPAIFASIFFTIILSSLT
ncbi:MAG TPA: DUF554 domain-containing protein [Thermoanaerobacterales bacterium]|nr:DUF554 domain-containing protein [Thermoanaerobacterales bacterium]